MHVTFVIVAALLSNVWATDSDWGINRDWANINRSAFRYLRLPFQRDFDSLRTQICSGCLSQCRDSSRNFVNVEAEGDAVSGIIPLVQYRPLPCPISPSVSSSLTPHHAFSRFTTSALGLCLELYHVDLCLILLFFPPSRRPR